MTYYELIKDLRILEKEKRNEEAYNSFINSDIVLYTNMNYRLGMHLMKFLRNKIDNCYKDFINRLVINKVDSNELSVQFVDLRNELNYIESFTNLKYLIDECNKDLNDIFNDITTHYNDTLKKSLKDVYGETFSNNFDEIIRRKEGN